MTNAEIKNICLSLLKCDHEDEVIKVIEDLGLWKNANLWRYYGDRDGNYSTIGNQQSRPEAALVEKIINSVDARLMNECLVRGTSPTSSEAPGSIKHAVASYFEAKERVGEIGGSIRDWDSRKRTEEAVNITLAATGPKKSPCLTIADAGEGQTPEKMPYTFLSIDRDNKLRIPFVQGKFNMGGTGALKFCGKHGIQLIISKRNPEIVQQGTADLSHDCWGFTVVRRERPTQKIGAVRNSVYTYLAPIDAENMPRGGRVLRFKAHSLQLMPRYNKPYVREMPWGSVVKLYNYDMKGFRSHILWGKGCLLYRLEALMPEIALPIRMHECRDYGGKEAASFETTLAGLSVRLEEGKGVRMEEGFPSDTPFTVKGESMIARVYLLAKLKGEKGKADTYRTNEGVLFTINGQTHGAFPKSLFGRDKVKMSRLADSLLVTVDCSGISVGAREDLFMNSRDRLSNGELRKAIESEIQSIIGQHQGLRAIRAMRCEEEISRRLSDSKPLEDVLRSIFKSSPSLAALFLTGQRLSSPFQKYSGNGKGDEGGGQEPGEGKGQSDLPFSGKPYPTYFRFHNQRYGQTLLRNSEAGRRCRLKFDTDVENSYFCRSQQPGKYVVEILEGANGGMELNHSLTLHNGIASWSIDIPEELEVGHSITLQCHVFDEVNSEGFTNVGRLTIIPKGSHGKGKGRRASRHKDRDNRSNGKGSNAHAGIHMPNIVKVTQDEWGEYGFDQYTGCKIICDVDDKNGEDHTVYTFYVNVDNLYLKTDMKGRGTDPRIVQDKFVYANVLLGLALVHDLKKTQETSQPTEGLYQEIKDELFSLEDYVFHTTRAVAPFIIPMIDYLGSLSDGESTLLAQAGDED